MSAPALLGIDTGGTFTDFLLVDGTRLEIFKILSTPDEPSRAVLEGLARATEILGREPEIVAHGFTVATNALLTGAGARTTFVTTAGFEDLLAIGRQTRPDLYALQPRAHAPLVPSARVVGVRERVGPHGEPEIALTRAEIRRVVAAVRKSRPHAVSVCLLHSYRDPRHEQRIGEAIVGALGPDVPVSLSSEVTREYREFERASTTTVNAYLSPTVRRYLGRLHEEIGDRLRVMQSNGGAVPADAVVTRPVLSVLSGPAGGVLGASRLGKLSDASHLLTLDVGGTSTDVAVLPGEVRTTKEASVGGWPLRVPMLELETVGAGGGSIARVDRGGALRVGPESAGADPGPACYGRGGGATVTDANVVLGRIPSAGFAGGSLELDVDAAWRVLGELAVALGYGSGSGRREAARRAARGVVQVVNANMERALRVVSVARGFDPREFALLAFGGAGGLHAAELGRALSVREVIVPPAAGVLSAWGLLAAPEAYPVSRTVLWTLESKTLAQAERVFAELERGARSRWGTGLRFRRSADLRYVGQSFEFEVPWSGRVAQAFHDAHEQRYGYRRAEQPIELVNCNVVATRPGPRVPTVRRPKGGRGEPLDHLTIDDGSATRRAPVYERDRLGAGAAVRGPALLLEYGATTYLPTGATMRIDAVGNARITG